MRRHVRSSCPRRRADPGRSAGRTPRSRRSRPAGVSGASRRDDPLAPIPRRGERPGHLHDTASRSADHDLRLRARARVARPESHVAERAPVDRDAAAVEIDVHDRRGERPDADRRPSIAPASGPSRPRPPRARAPRAARRRRGGAASSAADPPRGAARAAPRGRRRAAAPGPSQSELAAHAHLRRLERDADLAPTSR